MHISISAPQGFERKKTGLVQEQMKSFGHGALLGFGNEKEARLKNQVSYCLEKNSPDFVLIPWQKIFQVRLLAQQKFSELSS